MSKAILLSGGMDSIALAFWKKPDYAITIDYGQRPAESEIRASKSFCKEFKLHHHIIKIDCSSLGSGDLSNKSSLNISPSSEWWPYRNQMIITLALMKAITLNIEELMIGTVNSDSTHKDGNEDFINYISQLTAYQEGNIKISAPAIKMSTNELIIESKIPHSSLLWAHSCHTSNYPCMKCRGCLKYLYNIQEFEARMINIKDI